MQILDTKFRNKKTILALGAESAGNFSIYKNGKIYYYSEFGNLLDNINFENYIHSISAIVKKGKFHPDIILIDLHPLFNTSVLGAKLSKKYKAKLIKVQHHIAHIFAVVGEYTTIDQKNLPKNFTGIACDGTGYGEDGKIWGGEIFDIDLDSKRYQRIGHLENQTLLGGEASILNPARMLIGILGKFLSKEGIYQYVQKYYSRNEFELLYNQLKENFNCVQTSSTGRILDAVSILLGFTTNKINFKHEAIKLLQEKSSLPYEIEPDVFFNKKEDKYILNTTKLFEYLIKNIKKDKGRLAATAQLYIAKGLLKIAEQKKNDKIFFGGGIAENKIISDYMVSAGAIVNQKFARGDNAISLGQIFYYLMMI